MEKICSIDGCNRTMQARGYCHTHYEYFRRNHKIKKLPVGEKKCSIDGCDNKHSGKGYCAHHLNKWNRYGDALYKKEPLPEFCKIEGCSGKRKSLGYCVKHYKRFSKHGDPLFINPKHEEHGLSNTPEYSSWRHMKERCYNKNHDYYKYYGGRGITVCKEWFNSFSEFYKYMGVKPFPAAEIDRKNIDGNYEPGNCRWSSKTTNIRNSRVVKINIEIARSIRKKFQEGVSRKKLSEIYNTDYSDVCLIVKNKMWKEVSDV